jgi:hypothetical protein
MSEVNYVGGAGDPPIGQNTFGGYWSACMSYTSLPASINTGLAFGGLFSPIVAGIGAFTALASAGICALAGVQTLQ